MLRLAWRRGDVETCFGDDLALGAAWYAGRKGIVPDMVRTALIAYALPTVYFAALVWIKVTDKQPVVAPAE